MAGKIDEALLEDGLARLEGSRSWSPRVVSRLEHFIRDADDYGLYYVNPLTFARDRGIPEAESIDLLVYAVHHGLFQFHWQLICPICGDRVRNFRSLKLLEARYFCPFCQEETIASLDDYIEVSFSIAPRLRPVSFHEPGSLPIDDYCFRYRLHPCGRLPGGLSYVQAMKDHTRGLAFLPPGDRRTFTMDLTGESCLGHDFESGANLAFEVAGPPRPGTQDVEVRLVDGAFQGAPATVAPGRIALTVVNAGPAPAAFMLLAFFQCDIPADRLVFDPFLTGKRLLTTRTYHDLFQTEIPAGTEGIGIRDVTILFTDLKGSTAMYDRVGDLRAFSLVRQHFNYLERAINRSGGVLVKTIGDAIMAAFATPEAALRAAVEMIREIHGFSETLGGHDEIRLKVGLHRGHSIVVSQNDRLDYFGQTVNVAARVQGLADADEIFLTDEVYRSPEVRDVLGSLRVTPQVARLKGVQEECKVYRVASA